MEKGRRRIGGNKIGCICGDDSHKKDRDDNGKEES